MSDDLERLRVRIAEALGWTIEETKSFSLLSLVGLVRPIDAKLASEIITFTESGAHFIGDPLKQRKWRE